MRCTGILEDLRKRLTELNRIDRVFSVDACSNKNDMTITTKHEIRTIITGDKRVMGWFVF